MGEADIYKKILDKIKVNGIKENNTSVLDLIKEKEKLQEELNYYQNYGANMLHENNELQQRIEKAVEYLEKPYRDNFDYSKAELLNILNGKE